MKNTFLVLVLVLLFINCDNSNKRPTYYEKNNLAKTKTHPGKKLMELHCYTCHSNSTSEANQIAPPMIAVKIHYIGTRTTKKEFIADMQKWIKEPIASNVKMSDAVNRFGMMQKLPYPEHVIEQIADYMFDNDIEQPEWFQEHYNQNKGAMNLNKK